MADFREDLGAILSPNLANNRIESEPETIRGEGSLLLMCLVGLSYSYLPHSSNPSLIDFKRKDINQLFVVAFLSRLDGASVASTCHQRVIQNYGQHEEGLKEEREG